MKINKIKKVIIDIILGVVICSSTVLAETKSFKFELERGDYLELTQERATKADSEQTAYITATSVVTNNPMQNYTQGVFLHVERYTTGNQVTNNITVQKSGRYTTSYWSSRPGVASKKYVLCAEYDSTQAGSYCDITGRWTP